MDVARLQTQAEVLTRLMKALMDAPAETCAVLATLAREIARTMDVYCRFLKVSEDGQWLESEARGVPPHRPVSEETIRVLDAPIPIQGDSLAARVVREQRTVVVGKVTEAQVRATFADSVAQETALALVKSGAVLVPVIGSSGLHGVLSLVKAGDEAPPFDELDVRFAEQLAVHAALALRSSKVVAAARERAERLQLVSDLTREVAEASGNFQQLLEVIVRRLGSAIADFCVIRLVRPDGKGFSPGGAAYNRDSELEPVHRTLLHELDAGIHPLLVGETLEGTTIRIPHVDLPTVLAASPAPFVPLLERIAPTTYMAVPLKLQGPPIAVLLLGRARGGAPFTEDEQRVVEDLAIHATIAMTNTRLLERTARTVEQLRVLTETAAELDASVEDPGGILEKVAHKLSEHLHGVCVLQLVAEDGETIEALKAIVHPDPTVVAAFRAVVSTERRKAEGLTRRALAGEVVMISGTPHEVAVPVVAYARELIVRLGVRSMMALPLRVGSQVIGAVLLARLQGTYTEADMRLAQDLLTHAALAIRNSRLLASMQYELAERARAEQALRQSEEQLRHAQKMEAVGRLAGGVAHDFNNLLTVVLHSCGFITDALPQQSPIQEDVEQIRQAGERASKLTRQLLAFSRQQVLNPEVLDLGVHVGNMRGLLKRLLGEQCVLVVRTTPTLWKVKADGTHVEQIVMNLAINARDAMPRGGTLTVETSNIVLDEQRGGSKAGPYVRLSVSDTGEGMTKETQERIFEPFFTTKPVGKGTGLGLSTVFGIVEQNGGTIWTSSEIGKGTTFEVYLPRTDAASDGAVVARAESAARGGETILVVEDEDAVRRTVVRALGRKGYRVIETRNGREALEACDHRVGEIDLVLTDVMMPVMGGGELAKRLLVKHPMLPVLFMSGYIDDSILEAGIIEPETVIPKPLNLELLMRKIRTGLDTRHS
jgi:signal transduction histidine kinase